MKKTISTILILLCAILCNCSEKKSNFAGIKLTFDEQFGFFVGLLEDVLRENEKTAQLAGRLIEDMNAPPRYPRSIYYKNKTGTLADYDHIAKSNIYITIDTKITEDVWKMIQVTESLEDRWIEVQKRYPSVGWQYLTEILTKVTRTYPWLDEVSYVGPSLDYTTKFQVTLVEPKNNPKGENVCSHVYFDHDGLGYMISCMAPVVSHEKFVGSMSIDLTVAEFFKPVGEKLNSYDEICSYIIDKKGTVIANTNNANKLFSCKSVVEKQVVEKGSLLYEFMDDLKCVDNGTKNIKIGDVSYGVLCKKVPYLSGYFIGVYKE